MSSSGTIRPDRDTTAVVGARIWAQLVDLVILFVQTGVVGVALARIVRPDTEGGVTGLTLVTFLTLPLYGGLLEGYWNGQTVGKRLLDIKVVDMRGTDPSVEQALVRNFPAVVLFSWLTTVVALAAVATSDRRQRASTGPLTPTSSGVRPSDPPGRPLRSHCDSGTARDVGDAARATGPDRRVGLLHELH